MKIVTFLVMLIPSMVFASEKEYLDYNFDGHNDYRIYRESDGKRHFYDIFLFDPASDKYIQSDQLSRLCNPSPDPKAKEIHCRWPGGHSGAIFSEEIYRWKDNRLEYIRSVGQSNYSIDGKIFYIRTTLSLVDDRPSLQDLQIFKPEELRK